MTEWEKEIPVFKTNLAKWREVEGHTLQNVADELENFGVKYSWQYIQKIEKGEKKPPYDFMMYFRIAFDENIDGIFFNPEYYN